MTWVLALVLKSTVVLAAAAVVAMSWRRSSASSRHALWSVALASLIVLPVLSQVVPRWEVAVLPPVAPMAARPAAAPGALEVTPAWDESEVAAMPAPAPSSSAPAMPVRPRHVRDVALSLWLLGAVFGLAQLALGTVLIAVTVRRARTIADEEWSVLTAEAGARLRLARRVELRETGSVPVPVVWGYWRPVILLPRDAAAWPLARRRAFLLHELSHVARYDCFTQTLAYVVRALYWPHPLVWWAVGSLRREAERACDDCVVAAGTEAPEYAQHLLEAARSLPRAPRTLATASAVIERTSLGARLLALLDDRLNRRAPSGRALAVGAGAAAIAVAVVAAVQPVARAAVVEVLQAAGVTSSAATPTPRPAPPSTARPTPRPVSSALMVHGVVKGPDGKPIADALVVATGPRRAFAVLGRQLSTRTNPAGEFRLEAFAGKGPYVLQVGSPRLALRELEDVVPGPSIEIVMRRGMSLAGSVVDATTRRPVAGAIVSTTAGPMVLQDLEAGHVAATSDEKGRYRLEGLPSAVQRVTAGARGYVDEVQHVAPGPAAVDFFLRRGGASLVGIVEGADGGRLARALVVAHSMLPGASTVGSPTRTDTAGRFEMHGVEPGTYRLLVRHPEWATSYASEIEAVASEQPSPAIITLSRPYRVTGRLVSGAGEPTRGQVAVQALEGAALPGLLLRELSAEAAPDGRFVIDGVPPGALTLAVRPLRFAARRAEVVAAGKERVVDAGDILVETGHAIRGRVRTRDGAPIAGARVYVPRSADVGDTETADDGTFVLAGIKQGTQGIAIHADGYTQEDRYVDADGPPIDVVLQPAAGITGVLVDAAGRPVSGAAVFAHGSSGRLFTSSQRLTDTDGRFRLQELRVETYNLDIQPREHLDKKIDDVTVEAGRTTDLGRIALEEGLRLQGVVVDSGGAPVAGAQIQFHDGTQAHRSNDRGQVQRPSTDSRGRFVIKALTKGVAYLSATHPSYAASEFVEVNVDPAAPAEARLVLSEGGRITGTARRRDGLPVVDAFVMASGPRHLRHVRSLRAPIGADGTFSIEHVTPGAIAVVLMQGGGDAHEGVLQKWIEVREGETATVSLDVREIVVSGQVLRSGRPLPAQHVRLSGEDTGGGAMYGPRGGVRPARVPPLQADTKADGTYELLVPGPGRYDVKVHAVHESRRGGLPKLDPVVVPDVPAFRYDIVVPEWSVTGRVVAKDTKQPIDRAMVTARLASGEPGGAATGVGDDGRFRIALDPGRYQLHVAAPHYVAQELPFEAGSTPVERSFELVPGASIQGTIAGPEGELRGAADVTAVASDGRALRRGKNDTTGVFTIEGLGAGVHLLFAHDSQRGEFALQGGATPGDAPVSLVLTAGATARLSFKDANGRPLASTAVRLDLVGMGGTALGVEGRCVLSKTQTTDAAGAAEFWLPTGVVDVVAAVAEPRLRGEAKLTVPAGIPVSAEVHLVPRR